MRIVVVTSAEDTVGAAFARSYYAAGGVPPVLAVVMEGRKDHAYPWWAQPWVALRLFGWIGTVRVLTARKLGRPLFARDKQAGLEADWLDSIVPPPIPRVTCRTLDEPEALEAVREARPDLLVSLGAPRILKASVLGIARLGTLNVHNARLPEYRGHFGTFWEVLHGERFPAVSIHEMTATVDSGRLLVQEEIDLALVASFLDLLLLKKRRGGKALAELIQRISTNDELPDGVRRRSTGRTRYFGWPAMSDVSRFRFSTAERIGAGRL